MDVRDPPSKFCTNAKYVRRSGTGIETWQCLGHTVAGSGFFPKAPAAPAAAEETSTASSSTDHRKAVVVSDLADLTTFPHQELQGLRLVEAFAGNPSRGGCMLSSYWERAGGVAERRDYVIDDSHDFFKAGEFWTKD